MGQPFVEDAGELVRVDLGKQVVEGVVAGQVEAAGVFFTAAQTDGAALFLTKRAGFAPAAFDVLGAAQQTQADDAKHRADGVAAAAPRARIGHQAQGLVETAELVAFERAAGSGDAVPDACGMGRGEFARAA